MIPDLPTTLESGTPSSSGFFGLVPENRIDLGGAALLADLHDQGAILGALRCFAALIASTSASHRRRGR